MKNEYISGYATALFVYNAYYTSILIRCLKTCVLLYTFLIKFFLA